MAIRITTRFDGYPDGKVKRTFSPGERPTDLPPGYADLLVTKGLAEREAEAPARPKRRRKRTPAA